MKPVCEECGLPLDPVTNNQKFHKNCAKIHRNRVQLERYHSGNTSSSYKRHKRVAYHIHKRGTIQVLYPDGAYPDRYTREEYNAHKTVLEAMGAEVRFR